MTAATVTGRGHEVVSRSQVVTASRIAAITVVTGVLLIVDVVVPRDWSVHSLVAGFVPPTASATARALALVGGWFLLRLARGLRRRKRTEWRLAVATSTVVLTGTAVREDIRPLTTLVVAGLLVALLVGRRQFTVGADAHSRFFALRVLVQGLVITFAYGTLLLVLPGRLPGHVSFPARLGEVAASAVGLGDRIPINGPYYADLFHATVLTSTLLAVVSAVVVALRPPAGPDTLAPADESRLRDLLARQGLRDSLGYFALRRDKSVVWSESGKAAIAFRVLDGVALVSGDPLGDPEAWPGAIAAFRDLVERHGWVPAAMGSSELGATILAREYGLRALTLGDEAILDIESFSLVGRAMRDVRHACTRMQRAGYQVVVRRVGEIERGERGRLAELTEQWRGDDVERGFSMALSRFGDADDGCCVVVTAVQDGEVRGLLHFVPWGCDGLSLDLMRRDRTADNGLNEFMIAELVAACTGMGVSRVSLNFAVFRDAIERGERIGAGPMLRLWRSVLLTASRWYQIESLYRFNDKFAPRWEPRFFCYSRARDLPRVALAALEAEAFVVRRPGPRGCPATADDAALGSRMRRISRGGVALTVGCTAAVVLLVTVAVTTGVTSSVGRNAARLPGSSNVAPSRTGSSTETPPSAAGATTPGGSIGSLSTRTIPGTTSHFVARPAVIWRPPALRIDPGLRLPVLELLIGEPGAPENWVERGDLVRRLTAVAARHDGRAPIVVVVDENGSSRNDTECVSTRNGDVERYLTVDVPHWIDTHLPAAAGRQNFAIGGLSEGGTCALMLALRHQQVWSTFDDISGLARLTIADHDNRERTVTELFDGSEASFDAHDPTVLLSRNRYPTTSGELYYGVDDVSVAHDVQVLRPLIARAGVTTRFGSHAGKHDWTVFGAGLSSFLSWWHPGF